MPEIPTLLEHLEKHQQKTGIRDGCAHCICGWKGAWGDYPGSHRAHVAETYQEATNPNPIEFELEPTQWIAEVGRIKAAVDRKDVRDSLYRWVVCLMPSYKVLDNGRTSSLEEAEEMIRGTIRKYNTVAGQENPAS